MIKDVKQVELTYSFIAVKPIVATAVNVKKISFPLFYGEYLQKQ